jgi:hypothetical protein
MIAGAFAGLAVVVWLIRRAAEPDSRKIDRRELARLRLLSEQIQRTEIYPFD